MASLASRTPNNGPGVRHRIGRDVARALLPASVRDWLKRRLLPPPTMPGTIMVDPVPAANPVHDGPLVSVVVEPAVEDVEDAARRSLDGQTLRAVECLSGPVADALARARGRYVCRLATGDRLGPTFLEKAVMMLEANRGLDLIAAHDADGRPTFPPFRPESWPADDPWRGAVATRAAWTRRSSFGGTPAGACARWVADGGRAGVVPERLVALAGPGGEDHGPRGPDRLFAALRDPWIQAPLVAAYRDRYADRPDRNLADLSPPAVDGRTILFIVGRLRTGGVETLLRLVLDALADDGAVRPVVVATEYHLEHNCLAGIAALTPFVYCLSHYLPAAAAGAALRRIARHHRADTVVVSNTATGYAELAALKAERKGIRTIAVLHLSRPDAMMKATVAAREAIDVHVAITEKLADELAAATGADRRAIRVIENAIDVDGRFDPAGHDREAARARFGLAGAPPVVAFIGRLSAEKGPDRFLDMAERLGGLECRFLLVGEGPERAAVERRARDLDRDGDRILLRGFAAYDEMPALLAAIDVLVLPSRLEGSPLILREAMAMARPVVASAAGDIRDRVADGETGFVVDPATPAGFAERVEALVRDPALGASLGRAARAGIKSSNALRDMQDAYRGLLLARS